ncbi:MAG: hypothetical protein NTV01_14620 [Bacteroidia bacterium]|nr:hypothetical protein [Bacteroidia bacterium]
MNNWAGHDPYDALNSELFKHLPFLDFWLPRLALTQLLKRSPINFRPLLMIPKTQNPKALALFLMAFLKLPQKGQFEQGNSIEMMIESIKTLRSPDTPYWCWGYSFPWQGRSVLAPRGEPNIVCTVFVANALTDIYEKNHATDCLTMATSAAEYLLNELYWSEGDNAGFSYPLPSFQTRVHNANFLGAALFCRIYKHTGEKKYLEPALKAARYSASMQHPDGGWDYGEQDKQNWIDNFHTGYNLDALRMLCNYLNTDEFEPHIRRGFKFYRDHFFREDGAPKYFHNKTYPIDIHSVAQSIITLIEFRDLDQNNIALAHRVLEWTMANMWDDRGYFYYQVTPYYKNKISYMRWSQAWMLLALATLLRYSD